MQRSLLMRDPKTSLEALKYVEDTLGVLYVRQQQQSQNYTQSQQIHSIPPFVYAPNEHVLCINQQTNPMMDVSTTPQEALVTKLKAESALDMNENLPHHDVRNPSLSQQQQFLSANQHSDSKTDGSLYYKRITEPRLKARSNLVRKRKAFRRKVKNSNLGLQPQETKDCNENSTLQLAHSVTTTPKTSEEKCNVKDNVVKSNGDLNLCSVKNKIQEQDPVPDASSCDIKLSSNLKPAINILIILIALLCSVFMHSFRYDGVAASNCIVRHVSELISSELVVFCFFFFATFVLLGRLSLLKCQKIQWKNKNEYNEVLTSQMEQL
jgi:hypothetical protein